MQIIMEYIGIILLFLLWNVFDPNTDFWYTFGDKGIATLLLVPGAIYLVVTFFSLMFTSIDNSIKRGLFAIATIVLGGIILAVCGTEVRGVDKYDYTIDAKAVECPYTKWALMQSPWFVTGSRAYVEGKYGTDITLLGVPKKWLKEHHLPLDMKLED